MLRIDSSNQNIFKSVTYQIYTPDGTMYVNLLDDKSDKLVGIDIQVGKAGGALRAWAHCFGRMLTMLIEHGTTIEEIITELSSQTSDKTRMNGNGISVRSGPEGVYYALMMYKGMKYEEIRRELRIGESKSSGVIHNRNRLKLG